MNKKPAPVYADCPECDCPTAEVEVIVERGETCTVTRCRECGTEHAVYESRKEREDCRRQEVMKEAYYARKYGGGK